MELSHKTRLAHPGDLIINRYDLDIASMIYWDIDLHHWRRYLNLPKILKHDIPSFTICTKTSTRNSDFLLYILTPSFCGWAWSDSFDKVDD